MFVYTWRVFPPKRKRSIGLVGLAKFTSVTVSLIATVIA